MFVVSCPKCDKQINLPEASRGKRVRCMGCKEIVLASVEPVGIAAVLPPARRPVPPMPVPELVALDESPEEIDRGPVPDAVPGLQCVHCEAAAVVELPPDANSRQPGYICAMCRTEMRRPGTAGNYYAAAFIGTVIVLLGLGLLFVALQAKQARNTLLGGGLAVLTLGAGVAGWGFYKARLPVPVGAKASPARLGFWLLIVLIGLALAGGGGFALMTVMNEVM